MSLAGRVLGGMGSALAADPFAFRGIALGAGLDEVRRVRFAEAPAARLLCSHDDAARDLRPSVDFVVVGEEEKAGVRVCGSFVFGKALGPSSSVLPPEWIAARLKVGEIGVRPTFWFVPPVAGAVRGVEGRLYKIAMRGNSEFWDETLAELVRRHGKPTSTEAGKFTGWRGQIDNVTVTWSNGESTIRLVKRYEMPQRMLILYRHNVLAPAGT